MQPLLHVCQESCAELSKVYRRTVSPPYLAVSLKDTVLWIRYGGPRTFDNDARTLQHLAAMQYIKHLALLINFWNRITTDYSFLSLYCTIKNSDNLKLLSIVDDNYGPDFRWSEMKEKRAQLQVMDWPLTAQVRRRHPPSEPNIFKDG